MRCLIWTLVFLLPYATWGDVRKSRDLVERAKLFEVEGYYFSNPKEAQRLLRKAIEEDSTNIEAYYLLGRSYWRDSGKIEKAMSLLRETVWLLSLIHI